MLGFESAMRVAPFMQVVQRECDLSDNCEYFIESKFNIV